MPIKPENLKRYPANWPEIRARMTISRRSVSDATTTTMCRTARKRGWLPNEKMRKHLDRCFYSSNRTPGRINFERICIMKSPTIEMERSVALTKLESYEQAMRDKPQLIQQIDRDVMRGYKVLAKGGRLLDVNEAIRHGGLNLAGIPKLAIARADADHSHWHPSRRFVSLPENKHSFVPDGGGEFIYRRHSFRSGNDQVKWKLPTEMFASHGIAIRNSDAEALVPFIPLMHRPRHHLSNYFLLWEANWQPAPPVDPYLLRPITGSLMEILAEWDISPVELAAVRAAMRETTR